MLAQTSSPQNSVHQGCPRKTRLARLGREHARFRKNLLALVRMLPAMKYNGGNGAVGLLALHHGFKAIDLVFASLTIGSRIVTLIGVPMRHWHRPETMARIHAVKAAALDAGYRCVLIPESVVQKQPRLDNANLLEASRDITATATERMSLLMCLLDNGDCSLSDCATLFQGPDPYGAILNLAANGIVEMNLDEPIGPHSLVKLPAVTRP